LRSTCDVDVLVNNTGNAGSVGWRGMKPFAETDPADGEPCLRVDLHGVMNCVRAALPHISLGTMRTLRSEGVWSNPIRQPGDPSRDAGGGSVAPPDGS
jgi:NAD(P)-dependent dehydrogenase (short-subunit alcohol dehydrogenase family)